MNWHKQPLMLKVSKSVREDLEHKVSYLEDKAKRHLADNDYDGYRHLMTDVVNFNGYWKLFEAGDDFDTFFIPLDMVLAFYSDVRRLYLYAQKPMHGSVSALMHQVAFYALSEEGGD